MILETTIAVTVEALAPLHIGGRGNPLTGMENAVAKVGDRLVIPGPTLKGALRHQMESYLIDMYYDRKAGRWPQEQIALQPCMAGAGDVSREEAALIAAGRYRRTDDRGQRSGCVYGGETGICPVCYLLGAQGLTGFVRVPFLEADRLPDELYSGRVNRATGTIAHATNRPYELVAAGTTFRGSLLVLQNDDVRGWVFGQPRRLAGNATPDRWLEGGQWSAERIMEEMLEKRLQAITCVGGYRSKGFGRIKLTISKA